MDVTAVYEAAVEAVKRAREGKGPTLIECKTYRWQGHHVGDPATYRQRRSKTEKEDWMKKCPVTTLRAEMIASGKVKEDRDGCRSRQKLKKRSRQQLKFAADSDYPDPSEAFTDVFQQGTL